MMITGNTNTSSTSSGTASEKGEESTNVSIRSIVEEALSTFTSKFNIYNT